jgi:hypothetical protein
MIPQLSLKASTAESKLSGIEELVNKGLLSVMLNSKGGYQEDCMQIVLRSNSPDTLRTAIEAGRRLIADDSIYQDILIVKEQLITLLPRETKTIAAYGFCCQSSDAAPAKGSKFRLGYMAPPAWVRLTQLINKNSYPPEAIQHAVWVLSDNHDISSVHSDNINEIQALRELTAEIKGVKLPWYTLTFVKDTARLFSNKAERVFGNFDYYLQNNGMVSIIVKTTDGRVVKKLVNGAASNPGTYTYYLDMDVSQLPKGTYTIFVYADYSKLVLKKDFSI